ncbi:MAG TPA: hypothetical protein ENI68_13065 [Gammaproteobacteria bacterium]|nr:hypothetical protein [Gammaproteobacteria bacterium]
MQKNCHISDAQFAGNYTLCIYLLKMRELYRWETQQPFSTTLGNDEVGDWLKDREALWRELEDHRFLSLEIDGQQLDPFESDEINRHLQRYDLVYSGGVGRGAQPHFFLGELVRKVEHGDYSVLISGREFARDLGSPPAMSQGRTIYLRRESLRRMLWEKIEEWRWNRPLNAMSRTLAEYDFSTTNVERTLERLTDVELESMLDHEIGEIMAQDQLGEAWETLLATLPHSKAEIMLRAIRDHLADALSTLPALLQRQQTASIHFYFANLNSMRKHLYPGLMAAYEAWCQGEGFAILRKQMLAGKAHWQALCEEIMFFASESENPDIKSIEQRIEDSRL